MMKVNDKKEQSRTPWSPRVVIHSLDVTQVFLSTPQTRTIVVLSSNSRNLGRPCIFCARFRDQSKLNSLSLGICGAGGRTGTR